MSVIAIMLATASIAPPPATDTFRTDSSPRRRREAVATVRADAPAATGARPDAKPRRFASRWMASTRSTFCLSAARRPPTIASRSARSRLAGTG